ncbi:uncharacterized protein MELLADRAFT_116475 [Melampsora larici-populina 98AG31]|uniref:FHA domain-containing protein n=1 Tax=Melampsora larici-populina (strain 98AG31 / pathotype 3-4-7) TaxID=747676 RepID=F4RLQ8_MELLP|nr:uncharacterized protein MELLADRAFT_116475 [Melampsora larici-populina 98AG31]EGG06580.1 hypothetical protein MELLADRAFT_116475 [Melampsora larici-populina 98AG31]
MLHSNSTPSSPSSLPSPSSSSSSSSSSYKKFNHLTTTATTTTTSHPFLFDLNHNYPSSITHPTSPHSEFNSTSSSPSLNLSKRIRLDLDSSHSSSSIPRHSPIDLTPASTPISSPSNLISKSQSFSPSSSSARMIKPLSQSDIINNPLCSPTSKLIRKPSSRLLNSPSQRPTQSDHPHGTDANENDDRSAHSLHSNQSEPSVTNPAKKPRVRKSPSAPLRIAIQPGHCLVFGRKPDIINVPSEVNTKNTPVIPIKLPGTFTHASRTHCWCTLIAPPLGGLNMRIVVKGQNGLMVDGQRFFQGASAGVEVPSCEGEQIELGFWGGKRVECYVKLEDRPPQRGRPRNGAARLGLIGSDKLDNTRTTKRKGRPSQSTAITTGLEYPASHSRTPSGIILTPRSATSELAPSSHIKPPPSKRQCLSAGPDVSPYDPAILALPVADRVNALIPSLGLDLVGLIASAIVFAPRATVSTTEVIRGVLETQPSLAEAVLSVLATSSARSSPRPSDTQENPSRHRSTSAIPQSKLIRKETQDVLTSDLSEPPSQPAKETKSLSRPNSPSVSDAIHNEDQPGDERIERVVNACRPIILDTLQAGWSADGTGMFGCVTNEGLKDASGVALEALWYYQPQRDYDVERRANLQPYVRHVRHTQTTSKQYFFKKVRGSGRRRS